ncbi:AsmA family protein [Desulfocurvus sp. DL9XJH121]
MRKGIKIAALAAVVGLGLFLAAGAVLYAVVDTERVKTTLTELVREQTGRELAFKGEVSLSVFPWLGVEMGPVSLSNAPGFGDAPFAEVRHTDVRVKLLPLLSKDVQVRGVTIDGLRLNLARNAKGRTNWQDLAGTPSKAAPKAEAQDSDQTSGADKAAGPLLAGLSVDGVRITDAGVAWADAVSGQRCTVSQASLTTGPVSLGSAFDFSFAARAEAAEPALTANIEVSGHADPGQDLAKPRIDGLALSASADGKTLPGGHVDVKLGGDILVDLTDDTITVAGLKLSALGVDVSGGLRVARFDSDPQVDAALTFSEFNPKKLMAALGLPEIETNDPSALAKASGSIQATASMDSATLRKVDLKVDDTTLTGSAGVSHFAKPAIVFDLKAGTLDVNRYLPPASDKGGDKDGSAPAQGGAAGKDAAKPSSGLPKEQLRALDVDGKLHVGSLTVHKLRFKDLDVTVKAKDGLIRISPLTLGLYDGNLKTSLTADMRSDVTRSALDLDLSGLQLGGLLTDLLGQDKVTGLGAAKLALSGRGEDWASLARTLAGQGSVNLKNGVFKGFQIIPDKVRQQAAAKNSGVAAAKAEKQQPFQDISASFNVDKGVLSTGDVALKASGISATGKGTADLSRERIDTYAVVDMTALPNIPFSIKGDWSDPDISLDTVAFLEETAKSIVDVPVNIGKGAGEVGGTLLKGGGKILEDLGTGIRDIFGGKPKKKQD